ncbi:hypothetical protein GIB67_022624 [Kingdonia uniflora]|uniref:Uncharacterized protein n=1 Tax=Kingdonia uniflora TaxID=39325 RepID=A0A7J7P8L9_9MAGN|nr:hypothetical protein GIB67_022624 [Kingdonia uniflora]
MNHVSTGYHVDTGDALNFDEEPPITLINLELDNHDLYEDVDRNVAYRVLGRRLLFSITKDPG